MDLQGDEELEALRMAALATLKSHPSKKKDFESSTPDNISKVSTLITTKSADQQAYSMKDASDKSQGSAYGTKASWRNSQLSRRGRGRQFPKANHRSNLIVITPVNISKKTDEKEALPQLVLPQHKWCQSVNEDSSSPKSYRRVGPTRFNRHGSDSESSDESEYDNSDNDSYSNDTVLQDEPSEPFSAFTPEENTEDGHLVEKQQTTSNRRLSFRNIDSQEKERESIRNSRKDAYSGSSKEETKTYKAVSKENESKHEKEFSDNHHSITSRSEELVTKVRSHSPIQFQKSQSSSTSVNGALHSKKDNIAKSHTSFEKDNYKHSRKHSEKRVETDSHHDIVMNDSRNISKNLTEGDLRYELKKRMQEKPFKAVTPRSQNDSFDHRSSEQNRNHVHLRRSHSSEDSDHTHRHKSRDNKFFDRRSETQSRSSSENDRSASPTRNHISHGRVQTDTQTNRSRKRERSHSSDRSYKHSRSQSSEQRSTTQSRGPRRHSGSSSSSTSSSSSSSKRSSTSPRLRLISSVVKPVSRIDNSKTQSSNVVSEKRPLSSTESSSSVVFKRRRNSDEKPKILSSAVKSSVCGSEKHINTTDTVKRVPVHMRLGTLPHKRIIRMTKDVEAAFVSTSSDEDTDVNMKYKKQNYRVVTELSGNKLDAVSKRHVEKGTCRNVDVFKGRRLKIER